MGFKGRVALVTGAGSGMGQRACERLAAQGATIAALDVNAEGLERTAASSDSIHTFTCDVTDWDAVSNVVDKVEADLGPIDRMMAAAAIMPSGLAMDMDVADYKRVMDIDYLGVVHAVKATLPRMLDRRSGQQVVFSSLMGFLPTMHLAAYCAAKFAVRAFFEVTYHENRGRGVQFALVAPPAVQTPLLDQATSNPKTLGEAKILAPDEVLDAIEAGLDKDKFVIGPGQAKGALIAQRLIPDLIWKNMHKIEGI